MKNDCQRICTFAFLMFVACGNAHERSEPRPAGSETGGSATATNSAGSTPNTKDNQPSTSGGAALGTETGRGGIGGNSTTTSIRAGGSGPDTTKAQPPTSKVIISEIMYHPVEETTAEDEHEFVELRNTSDAEISLAGWKLHVGKADRLTLPASAKLPAGGYLVLAKRRDKLLEIAQYALAPDQVIGDFEGGLDNGGDKVSIVDAEGVTQDLVDYDDDAPWPIAADAFGAQEEWLPALGSYETHRYLGRSLERYSPALPSSDPRNWEASAVDGATPGKPNGISGDPPAIVLSASAAPESRNDSSITPTDQVRVTATLSEGAVSGVTLEYRLDPVEQIGTTTSTLPMTLKSGTPSTYEVVVPAVAANTVVRYRVLGASANKEVGRLGPRLTDPREYYAYFVAPSATTGPRYDLFITPQDWTKMWSNITAGRSSRCTTNATWDATVPAVFVHEGRVFDVQVRYQGSQNRRRDGIKLPSWTAPGPTQPNPLTVLSWRVKFPRYDQFEGLGGINLNKLKQACPGVLNALEGAMMAAAGIPAQTFRFVRVYVNGGYYAYMMESLNIEDDALEKFEGTSGPTGDLFKADGATVPDTDRSAGPWGFGNFAPLGSLCSLTPEQRYALTYNRENHDYKGLTPDGHAALISAINALDQISAEADADPAVRAYLEQNFDVAELITQYAIRNWAGTWDDGVHNYLPYQRSTDKKWGIFPHDFDCDFGGDPVDCGDWGIFYNAPTLSFYHPETGDGVVSGAPSQLKIQLIKAYRAEFASKVEELGETMFSEQNVDKLLEQVLSGFDRTAWEEAPARYCDLDARIAEAKQWLADRRVFLAGGVQ
ncbi:MAG: CotH kinase family protein [Myxococcales bacterium]